MIAMRLRISGPLSEVNGMPATVAEPDVGAISVPSVRTVVVFPAPLGPRNPKTSPDATVKDTSWNAVRWANCLVRWSTIKAGGAGDGSSPRATVIVSTMLAAPEASATFGGFALLRLPEAADAASPPNRRAV